MTYLELGLQEIGLLDRVLNRCREVGISASEYLNNLVTIDENSVQAVLPASTSERKSLMIESSRRTAAHAEKDPEWYRQQMIELSCITPGYEVTTEEARESCQD